MFFETQCIFISFFYFVSCSLIPHFTCAAENAWKPYLTNKDTECHSKEQNMKWNCKGENMTRYVSGPEVLFQDLRRDEIRGWWWCCCIVQSKVDYIGLVMYNEWRISRPRGAWRHIELTHRSVSKVTCERWIDGIGRIVTGRTNWSKVKFITIEPITELYFIWYDCSYRG